MNYKLLCSHIAEMNYELYIFVLPYSQDQLWRPLTRRTSIANRIVVTNAKDLPSNSAYFHKSTFMRFKSPKTLMICKTYCLLDDFVICRWLRWSTFFRWSLPRGTAAGRIRIRSSVLHMVNMAAMSTRSCSVGSKEERRRQMTDLEERQRMVLVGLSGHHGLPAQGLVGRAFRWCGALIWIFWQYPMNLKIYIAWIFFGYFDNIPWP